MMNLSLLPFLAGSRSMAVGAAVTVSVTQPPPRRDGMLWFNPNTWQMFLSINGVWYFIV
jgi:hypothetical protein